VARASGPGEGYPKYLFSIFYSFIRARPPIPAISPYAFTAVHFITRNAFGDMLLAQSKRRFYSEERDPVV
jgi:hypothetical protein